MTTCKECVLCPSCGQPSYCLSEPAPPPCPHDTGLCGECLTECGTCVAEAEEAMRP